MKNNLIYETNWIWIAAAIVLVGLSVLWTAWGMYNCTMHNIKWMSISFWKYSGWVRCY